MFTTHPHPRCPVFGRLVLLLALLFPLPTAAAPTRVPLSCATTLTYGAQTSCTITAAGGMNAATFSGTAGDRVVVRVAQTQANFYPQVRLLTPELTLLCQAGGSYIATAEITDCTLPTSGTYHLEVRAVGGTATGGYALTLQSPSRPGALQQLPVAELVVGSLTTAGGITAYTLPLAADEQIVVRVAGDGGTLFPLVRVYDAEGTERCRAGALYRAVADLDSCAVAAGTATVFVTDYRGTTTGAYRIMVQTLRQPAHAQPLGWETAAVDAILTRGAMSTYTFTGTAGAALFLRMARASGTVAPWLRLYGAGTLVCGGGGQYLSAYDLTSCVLPTSGTYTLLVHDATGSETGSYGLTLQRFAQPFGATALALASTQYGALLGAGEVDAYTLTTTDADSAAWSA